MIERFGRLVIIATAEMRTSSRQMVICQCDCGSPAIEIQRDNLTSGHTRSCGCLRREVARTLGQQLGAANGTHRDASRAGRVPEYYAWQNMVQRCTNPKNRKWKDYGGRGITVCNEWRQSYEAFLAYIGRRPTAKHSLDRFPDNDDGYKPGNVRWATQIEQNLNRRPSKKRGVA